jgi:histidinol phosphatase-like enzyme
LKLLLLDKDKTLVRPKSGAKFISHPEDQELIPGIAEALTHYRGNDWKPVIVTNQGGVAPFWVDPAKLKPGMRWRRDPSNSSQEWLPIVKVQSGDETKVWTDDEPPWTLKNNIARLVCHKTLGEAIAETVYACKLLGIGEAFLCPSAPKSLGDKVISIGHVDTDPWRSQLWTVKTWNTTFNRSDRKTGKHGNKPIQGFRKPESGMLQAATDLSGLPTEFLMVGDSPEDAAAAADIGYPFLWAADFAQGSKFEEAT